MRANERNREGFIAELVTRAGACRDRSLAPTLTGAARLHVFDSLCAFFAGLQTGEGRTTQGWFCLV